MSRQPQRYPSPFGANRKQGDALNTQNFLSSAGVQAALSGMGYGVNSRTLPNGVSNIPYLQPSLFASPKPAPGGGGRMSSDPTTPTTSNSGAAPGRPSAVTPGRSAALSSPKLGGSAYNPTGASTPTRKNSGGPLNASAPSGSLAGVIRTGSGAAAATASAAAAAAASLSVIGAGRVSGLGATFPSAATGGSRPTTAGGAALLGTTMPPAVNTTTTHRPGSTSGGGQLGRTGSGVPGFSFSVGSNQSMGSRGYQEDYRAIVDNTATPGGHANMPNVLLGAAVYDGHGGKQVSHWLASSYCLLDRAMVAVQALVSAGGSPNDVSSVLEDAFVSAGAAAAAGRMTAGSCVALALLVSAGPAAAGAGAGAGGMPWVLSANVGDSRTVLVSWDEPGEGGGGARLEATQLSVDHKLGPAKSSEETRRVQAAGGTVIQLFGTWRIDGSLAVARAIGDTDFGRYVSCRPTVQCRQLTRRDRWIIIASDGLWDVMSNEEVASFCRAQHQLSASRLAEALVKEAVRNRGSGDNTTVVAIRLVCSAGGGGGGGGAQGQGQGA